jgi:hypothetical protein
MSAFTERHPNVDPSDCECSDERGAKCLPCQFAATRELGFLDGLEAARLTASGVIDDLKQRRCADQSDRDIRDGGIAVLEGLRESLIGAPASVE